MSVRATGKLIGELVIVTDLPNSPQMVVKAFNAETNIITTAWFGDCKCYQEGTFPASALDRAEPKKVPPAAKAVKGKKPAGKK